MSARAGYSFIARARQDREIVYELLSPETHSFRLYHDYTEQRAGIDHYLNIVRPGSKASDPEAWDLDSGKRLRVETLRGSQLAARGIDAATPSPESEVIVIWFDAVPEGGTRRIRIEETYTDRTRYGLSRGSGGRRLLWDRAFGRPRNSVVLPRGWRLVRSTIPGTLRQTDDGRTRLDFVNDRGDQIAVLIEAVKR